MPFSVMAAPRLDERDTLVAHAQAAAWPTFASASANLWAEGPAGSGFSGGEVFGVEPPQRLHGRIERAVGQVGELERSLQQRDHVGRPERPECRCGSGCEIAESGPVQTELPFESPHLRQADTGRPPFGLRADPGGRSSIDTCAPRADPRHRTGARRPARRAQARSAEPTARWRQSAIVRRRVRLLVEHRRDASSVDRGRGVPSLWSPGAVAAEHVGARDLARTSRHLPPLAAAKASAASRLPNGTASAAPMPPCLRLSITKNAFRASIQLVAPGSSQLGARAMSDT